MPCGFDVIGADMVSDSIRMQIFSMPETKVLLVAVDMGQEFGAIPIPFPGVDNHFDGRHLFLKSKNVLFVDLIQFGAGDCMMTCLILRVRYRRRP